MGILEKKLDPEGFFMESDYCSSRAAARDRAQWAEEKAARKECHMRRDSSLYEGLMNLSGAGMAHVNKNKPKGGL